MSESEDVIARLDRMERQLAALIAERSAEDDATPTSPRPGTLTIGSGDSDPLWVLHGLQDRVPEPGAVVYAGSATVGAGHVEYQWGRSTEALQGADWTERSERLAALAHPLRLAILQQLLDGERTVAHLVDDLSLASTGVAYHHLNALQQADWVSSPRRGVWQLPAARVVPLLAIVLALEEG